MSGHSLRRATWLHPIVLAAFPIVFLWGENRGEPVALVTVLGLVAISVAGAAVLYRLLRLLVSGSAAGLLTSLVVVLFFSFGHVRRLADPSGIGDRDVRLLVLWGLLLVIVGTLAVRFAHRTSAPRATATLNGLAMGLLVLNLALALSGRSAASVPSAGNALPGADGAPEVRRDVYYLIFDRYASLETYAELGFDNAPMIGFLRDRGFDVPGSSLANYPKTSHSLASSLNFEYLDALAREVGEGSNDWGPLNASLSASRAARGFVQLGYRYDHLGSWWEPTRTDLLADRNYVFGRSSEFASVFLETTLWPTLADRTGLIDADTFEERQWERVRSQFRTLHRIAADPAPTFVFAHFTLPHPPYVFHEDGSFLSPQEQQRIGGTAAYLETVRYTNGQIRALVEDLLDGSDAADPIVILQSDEGPHPVRLEQDEDAYVWPTAPTEDLRRKLTILNAYYLPGDGEPEPYATISPVNTFRLVFSRYFGADLPLLEDRTYVYRDTDHPYEFTDVTSRLR